MNMAVAKCNQEALAQLKWQMNTTKQKKPQKIFLVIQFRNFLPLGKNPANLLQSKSKYQKIGSCFTQTTQASLPNPGPPPSESFLGPTRLKHGKQTVMARTKPVTVDPHHYQVTVSPHHTLPTGQNNKH
jgi:hypothetical protein